MDQKDRSGHMQTDGQERTEGARETVAQEEELLALLTRLPDPKRLSNAQKDRERKLFRERLKALNAAPRSDWHREFENILQIEVESWENGAVIDREVSIGEDAPRGDFLVVSETKLPKAAKSVFRLFLKKNCLEYKRPAEAVTERMVWKMAGYGALLIGTDIGSVYQADELTLSIFAYKKNEKQFASMLERGLLQTTDVKGVYAVHGMTPLPYQIVIAGELEGREYAAYRALSDRADICDVSEILETMKACSLQTRDRYFSILQTIEAHNPGTVRDMIREENTMSDIFLDLFEPQIQEREKKAAAATAADFTERMIKMGMDGPCIADITGYDRSSIDSIAKRLGRTVSWNESRA